MGEIEIKSDDTLDFSQRKPLSTDNLMEMGAIHKKLDKLTLNFDRIIDGLNDHYNLLGLLLSHLKKPLEIDDRTVKQWLSRITEKSEWIEKKLSETVENIKNADISQTLGEIKFIGKRLDAIESSIKTMKDEGIKKSIDLQFVVDGYTMVKKPVNHDESEPIEHSQNDLSKILQGSLLKREVQALILRYGLSGEKKHTFEKMGQIIGLSNERCRQIVAKALRKLRHPSRKEIVEKVTDKHLRKAIFGEE